MINGGTQGVTKPRLHRSTIDHITYNFSIYPLLRLLFRFLFLLLLLGELTMITSLFLWFIRPKRFNPDYDNTNVYTRCSMLILLAPLRLVQAGSAGFGHEKLHVHTMALTKDGVLIYRNYGRPYCPQLPCHCWSR